MLRSIPASLLLLSSLVLSTGCPAPDAPPADLCTATGEGAVASLQLGDGYDGFAPLDAESYSEVIYGDQGGAMMLFKLRAFGPGVPACGTVDVTLTDSEGEVLGGSLVSVRFHQDEGGVTRTTQPMRVRLQGGSVFDGMSATLSAQIGGAQSSVEITIREP